MYFFKFLVQEVSNEKHLKIINVDSNLPISTQYQIGNIQTSLNEIKNYLGNLISPLKMDAYFSVGNISRMVIMEDLMNNKLYTITCNFYETEDFDFTLFYFNFQCKVIFKKQQNQKETRDIDSFSNLPYQQQSFLNTPNTYFQKSTEALNKDPSLEIIKDENIKKKEKDAFLQLISYFKSKQSTSHEVIQKSEQMVELLEKLKLNLHKNHILQDQLHFQTIQSLLDYFNSIKNEDDLEKLYNRLSTNQIQLYGAIQETHKILSELKENDIKLDINLIYNKMNNFIKEIWQNYKHNYTNEIKEILSLIDLDLILPMIEQGETFDIKYHKIAKRQQRAPGQLPRQIIEVMTPGLILKNTNEIIEKATVVIAE